MPERLWTYSVVVKKNGNRQSQETSGRVSCLQTLFPNATLDCAIRLQHVHTFLVYEQPHFF